MRPLTGVPFGITMEPLFSTGSTTSPEKPSPARLFLTLMCWLTRMASVVPAGMLTLRDGALGVGAGSV